MKLTLLDTGGEKLTRFGAAGVKRILMNPVDGTLESGHLDFALVQCPESETFILRTGYGKRKYNLTVIFWDSSDEDAVPIEEHFDATDRDKAIERFLKLSKRSPVYADALARD